MKISKDNNITISPFWQRAFIVAALLTWLANFWFLIYGHWEVYLGRGSLVYQLVYLGAPIAWFAVSLACVWKKHRIRLHRTFSAMLLTFVGYGTYLSLSGLEETLRMRFYPPVITDMTNNSLLTVYGHEWLVQAIAFVLFSVILLVFWRRAHPDDD